jgi:phosphate transport system substrate-binding protein
MTGRQAETTKTRRQTLTRLNPQSSTRGRFARIAGVAFAVALLGAACSSDSDSQSGGDGPLSGSIEVSGSSTVEPVSTWVAEEYELVEPDVLVNVDGPGTGDGFELFCNGETDISNASRPIKAAEVEKCEANGIEFIELKVAIDGLAVITSANNNAVECLALEDIYALVGPESQGFSSWSDAQALATELGSDTQFPSAPLDVTAPGEESGTFDSFVELAIAPIGEERAEAGAISEDDAETTRPDYVSQASDNVIIQSISGSDTSFGWVGFAFAAEAEGVKMLSIKDADGNCVAPTPDTISSGEYPLARDLYIYVNAESASDAAVDGYVSYYVDNMALAAEAVGYVPLDSTATAATVKVWQDKTTGAIDGGK